MRSARPTMRSTLRTTTRTTSLGMLLVDRAVGALRREGVLESGQHHVLAGKGLGEGFGQLCSRAE
jgi:hypothetical protein